MIMLLEFSEDKKRSKSKLGKKRWSFKAKQRRGVGGGGSSVTVTTYNNTNSATIGEEGKVQQCHSHNNYTNSTAI